MRNVILKNVVTIAAGALMLGACGGRQDDQPTTPLPEATEPMQPPEVEEEPEQDTDEWDTTGTPPPGTSAQPAPPPQPDMGMQEQDPLQGQDPMHGQDMPGMGMHGHAHDMTRMPCPTDVPGTTGRIEQTARGIAIAFTTTDDVAEVRQRVEHLAEMHNRQHGRQHGQDAAGTAPGQNGDQTQQEGAQGPTRALGQDATQAQAAAARGAEQAATLDHDLVTMTEARAENIPGGARLVLTARDRTQVDRLRERLRSHAQSMTTEQCGIMWRRHMQPLDGSDQPRTGSLGPGATNRQGPRR